MVIKFWKVVFLPISLFVSTKEIGFNYSLVIQKGIQKDSEVALMLLLSFKVDLWDFPGPVAETLLPQYRRPGFNPWSGNQILPVETKDPARSNKDQRSHVQQLTHCRQIKKYS